MPVQMFIINKINILCIDKYQKKSFHYDIDHVSQRKNKGGSAPDICLIQVYLPLKKHPGNLFEVGGII